MRDFLALISASRPEVPIHLTVAAAVPSGTEEGYPFSHLCRSAQSGWIARSERDVNPKRRRRSFQVLAGNAHVPLPHDFCGRLLHVGFLHWPNWRADAYPQILNNLFDQRTIRSWENKQIF